MVTNKGLASRFRWLWIMTCLTMCTLGGCFATDSFSLVTNLEFDVDSFDKYAGMTIFGMLGGIAIGVIWSRVMYKSVLQAPEAAPNRSSGIKWAGALCGAFSLLLYIVSLMIVSPHFTRSNIFIGSLESLLSGCAGGALAGAFFSKWWKQATHLIREGSEPGAEPSRCPWRFGWSIGVPCSAAGFAGAFFAYILAGSMLRGWAVESACCGGILGVLSAVTWTRCMIEAVPYTECARRAALGRQFGLLLAWIVSGILYLGIVLFVRPFAPTLMLIGFVPGGIMGMLFGAVCSLIVPIGCFRALPGSAVIPQAGGRWTEYIIIALFLGSFAGVGISNAVPKIKKETAPFVFFDDFENDRPASAWFSQSISKTPRGVRGFLGPFKNDSIPLGLLRLPPHTQMTLSFDLYLMGNWNGNGDGKAIKPDEWCIQLGNGNTLFRTTFSTKADMSQAFPGTYPATSYPARTGAIENNTLGFSDTGRATQDSVYHLTFTFPHDSDRLGPIQFMGQLGEPIPSSKGWGLDNVKITLSGEKDSHGRPGLDRTGMAFTINDIHSSWDQSVAIEDHPALDIRGDATVSAWVWWLDYFPPGRIDDEQMVFWRGTHWKSAAGAYNMRLSIKSGKMRFVVTTGDGKRPLVVKGKDSAVECGEPIDGHWHFWTGVCDKTKRKLRLYRDGQLQGEADFTPGPSVRGYSPTMTGGGNIGEASGHTCRLSNGEIAEVQVWNGVRSPEQIRRDMGKLTGNEPGLAACWILNEYPQASVEDISPNHIAGKPNTVDDHTRSHFYGR